MSNNADYNLRDLENIGDKKLRDAIRYVIVIIILKHLIKLSATSVTTISSYRKELKGKSKRDLSSEGEYERKHSEKR